ncbi:DUF4328 domain-containing protein [Kitasatospora mediocidica]|uniref:DUF4328 domain-containing protein n=1 Tax=Kitasatospora mediocidica TaxID=58352 RepID=UPI0006925C52|nr:DUF4328 domain-containing protein [Kitasatospora mediocidica]
MTVQPAPSTDEIPSAEPGGRTLPRALAHRGLITDPRILGIVAGVLVTATTVAFVVTGVARSIGPSQYRLATGLSTPTFVAAIVGFLCWFSRCRTNAEAYAPGTHRHSPGFAIGAWFIPVAMWWIPRRVTLDIWRATGLGNAWLVNVWWATWIGRMVVGIVTPQLDPHHINPYALPVETAYVLSGVTAVLLIHRITRAQSAIYQADRARS